MAGYAATVCLPPQAGSDLAGALATALAPFGAKTDLEWDFGSLWDSWRIAGGSDGYGFWVRPGCEDDARLIHDSPHWQDNAPRLSFPGMCAGGPRELLDLSERPELGRALAIEAWEVWHRLAVEHPPALPLSLIKSRLQPDPNGGFDPNQVFAEFEAQSAMRAFRAAHPLGSHDPQRSSAEIQFWPNDLAYVGWGAEAFADKVVTRQLGGWNLVTLDGWWIEADGAAHHGTCGSGCPHRPDAYNDARGNAGFGDGMYRYLDALAPDALIVRVYGHC
ncbi:hypothetical protein ABH935_005692 [Catenulispora sp. GAS73]|uniref:hypothetical protein n=1 Tax=Catenulispora sp. GAS73 TaxID=3156269 RepID=UPI003516EE62